MKTIKELVLSAKNGNKKAFDKLYKLTSNDVWFTCVSLLKDEENAKDIMQETYITAFLKLDTLKDEEKIIECMNKALAILNDKSIECFFRISIFHYLFGYIHPFYDGNGRTSRFISSYLLSKEFESIIGYRMSYSIKENINDYYKAFKVCNDPKNKGDLTPFIIMFTDIIDDSLHKLVYALEKRLEQLTHYRKCIIFLPKGADEKYSNLYFLLIQASLFSESGISTKELMDVMKLSRSTVTNRLNTLSDYGLIIKKTLGNIRCYSLDINKIDTIMEEINK